MNIKALIHTAMKFVKHVALGAGLAAMVITSTLNKAEALQITPTQIGNFLVSGEYNDAGAQFQINYLGPLDPGFYGNEVHLEDVFFGGALTSWQDGWTTSMTTNPDGSAIYEFNSLAGNVNIQGAIPFNFSFDYAALDGFAVPAGIGSEGLTDLLTLSINDSIRTYTGVIAAPYSLTHAPSLPPSTSVPEPSTMALFGTGLAGLFAAGFRRKQ